MNVPRFSPTVVGIFCVLGGVTCISIQDAVIKWLSGAYPLHQIVFVRSLIAIVLFGGLLAGLDKLHYLKTRRPQLHLMRGLLLVVANSTYFLGLAAMPLPEAVAIFFVAPLFITLLSIPFLGEKVGRWRISAVVVGFAGVLVMVRPGDGAFGYAAALPVVAAFCYAAMQVSTRRLGVTDSAWSMAFYIQATFAVASAIMGLVAGDGHLASGEDPSLNFLLRAWTMPPLEDALLFGFCGVLVTFASYFLSQGYRIAEASAVAPFEYVMMPLAMIWGLMFWGHLPDLVSTGGIVMVVGAGLLVFYRENLRGRLVASRRLTPRSR